MIRFLTPGPFPKWLTITVKFSHEDRRHFARIASRAIAWRSGGILNVRPLFGGAVVLVECGSSSVEIRPEKVRVYDRPLIPLMRGSALRVQRFGEPASQAHHRSSTSS